MPRWFNTTGPCQEDIHYMLSPTLRIPSLERLIAQRNYFVIHAPRQIGKTTAMLALAKQLTESGQYTAIMLSVEVGAPFAQDITIKADPLSKGLEQLDGYLARLVQDEGWLVIFVAEGGRSHRRDNAPELEERLKTEIQVSPMGKTITVIRA